MIFVGLSRKVLKVLLEQLEELTDKHRKNHNRAILARCTNPKQGEQKLSLFFNQYRIPQQDIRLSARDTCYVL